MQRTKQLREEHSQLLISYVKPFKPVSKDTISRWVKQVLESAGIEIIKYSADSSRAASASSCKAKGLSLAVIMESAGWSKSSLFDSLLLNPDTLLSIELYHSSVEFGNKKYLLLCVVRNAVSCASVVTKTNDKVELSD